MVVNKEEGRSGVLGGADADLLTAATLFTASFFKPASTTSASTIAAQIVVNANAIRKAAMLMESHPDSWYSMSDNQLLALMETY